MNRSIIFSQTFVRAARRLVKTNPTAAEGLRTALVQLAENAFHPSLKTHKLKGDLAGFWASRVEYDLRVVFSFVPKVPRRLSCFRRLAAMTKFTKPVHGGRRQTAKAM